MKILALLTLLCVNSFAQNIESFDSNETVVEELLDVDTQKYVKSVRIKWLDEDLKNGDYSQQQICEGPLRPENKGQKDKLYHVEVDIKFDRKIPGPHPLCVVPQRSTSKCRRLQGEALNQCLWKNLRCLRVKKKVFKILSDTYRDSCGKLVRGFALVSFDSPGEDMNDSVSPGHSLTVDQVFSGGIASYKDGPVSSVEQDRFLLITPTF